MSKTNKQNTFVKKKGNIFLQIYLELVLRIEIKIEQL